MSVQEDLLEPLLSSSDDNNCNDAEAPLNENSNCPQDENSNCPQAENDADESIADAPFSLREEIWEMISLGLPLAISFFCRMGMASTDSAFVGHINDGVHKAEIYLAAAVLSDMCINVFITPPLAFNQVLNGLVGQGKRSMLRHVYL
jgi:MATE family multidrug resistance protein